MVKENLETKAKKAILRIEKKVADIYNVVRDLSLKLCHIIMSRKDHYGLPDGDYSKANT
jgi:hypothetical protein